MKTLSEILKGAKTTQTHGDINIQIEDVCIDSRQCGKNSLFAAIIGTDKDGHEYISKAIEAGAKAIVCQNIPKTLDQQTTYIQVANSAESAGIIVSNFFGNPSHELKLIGVTGTNGKTTTATLLHQLFRSMGFSSGLFSTIKILINTAELPATQTTPSIVELNRVMRKMVDDGCEYCFMEVSSHAIDQKRVAGLYFKGGIFSNITQDHLDYHKTMEQYIKAKQQFFDHLPPASFALTNIDDKNGNIIVQNTKAKRYSYGLKKTADFKARTISKQMEGMQLSFDGIEFWTPLIGEFNAYNLLAVYATAIILGFEKIEILKHLSIQQPVDGRFERYCSESGVFIIVDYAHTPDAVANVLSTINDIRTGNEKVITVIGAGGKRDKTKRPLMAKEAIQYSDTLIITSDNPRNENPMDIIEDLKKGLTGSTKRYLVNPDRKEAIKTACMMAQKGDIILIAGKGHEKFQEINGETIPFDDMSMAMSFFKN